MLDGYERTLGGSVTSLSINQVGWMLNRRNALERLIGQPQDHSCISLNSGLSVWEAKANHIRLLLQAYITSFVVTSSSQLSQSRPGQGVFISMTNPTFFVSSGPINPEQTVLALLKSLLYLLVSDTSTHWRPDVLSSTVNSQLPPCSLLVLQYEEISPPWPVPKRS